MYEWRCGGCGAPGVMGIYCDPCKVIKSGFILSPPAFAASEKVEFDYRGTVKRGIIEKVNRTTAVVLIEVNDGTKSKFVTVAQDALRGISQ